MSSKAGLPRNCTATQNARRPRSRDRPSRPVAEALCAGWLTACCWVPIAEATEVHGRVRGASVPPESTRTLRTADGCNRELLEAIALGTLDATLLGQRHGLEGPGVGSENLGIASVVDEGGCIHVLSIRSPADPRRTSDAIVDHGTARARRADEAEMLARLDQEFGPEVLMAAPPYEICQFSGYEQSERYRAAYQQIVGRNVVVAADGAQPRYFVRIMELMVLPDPKASGSRALGAAACANGEFFGASLLFDPSTGTFTSDPPGGHQGCQ